MKHTLRLINGQIETLNRDNLPGLENYLQQPKAQVLEMVRQINTAGYYDGLFSPDTGTFLDLGANLGLVSLFAAPCCKRVVAVEPESRTFSAMAELAKPFKNIECVQMAIASRTGMFALSVDRADLSCHTITNPKPGNSLTQVMGMAFPEFLEKHGLKSVDVCKVDIEGAEVASFPQHVINMAPVKVWYMEVHKNPSMTRDRAMTVMLNRFSLAGYRVATLRGNAIVASNKK